MITNDNIFAECRRNAFSRFEFKYNVLDCILWVHFIPNSNGFSLCNV